MTLSILIPSYFRGSVLNELLDSIGNFEHSKTYVCFDSLDDPNIEIIKSQYPWVTVFKKENGGLSDTRNYLFEHSEGDYILFIDDDDKLTQEYKEWLMNNLQTLKSQVYKTQYELFWPDGKTQTRKNGMSKKYLSKFDKYNTTQISTWLVSRKFYTENNLCFQKGHLAEDSSFAAKIFATKTKVEVLHLNSIHARQGRSDNISSNVAKHFDRYLLEVDYMMQNLNQPDYLALSYILLKHMQRSTIKTANDVQKLKLKNRLNIIYKRRFALIKALPAYFRWKNWVDISFKK